MQAWVLGSPWQYKYKFIFMFIKNTMSLCNVTYTGLEMNLKRWKILCDLLNFLQYCILDKSAMTDNFKIIKSVDF